jgi:hypothetical protein
MLLAAGGAGGDEQRVAVVVRVEVRRQGRLKKGIGEFKILPSEVQKPRRSCKPNKTMDTNLPIITV